MIIARRAWHWVQCMHAELELIINGYLRGLLEDLRRFTGHPGDDLEEHF